MKVTCGIIFEKFLAGTNHKFETHAASKMFLSLQVLNNVHVGVVHVGVTYFIDFRIVILMLLFMLLLKGEYKHEYLNGEKTGFHRSSEPKISQPTGTCSYFL